MTLLHDQLISLRAVEPEDLDNIYAWENDTCSWTNSLTTAPYSHHQVRRYIASTQSDIYKEGELRLIIECNADHAVVGIIDLCDLDVRNSHTAVSIYIASEYRHSGHAHAALSILTRYAFDFLKLKQLYAYIAVSNTASIRLFTKAGFSTTALLRNWIYENGHWTDVQLFQLINSNA
ncbi:MAG: GNAT family N-acetyltransferase [Paludibacteraceae bacterium]|nr:GNAT family N-acetyltransferase [Paludibacteraceae bacterium]